MAGTMGGFYVGVSGLQSSQYALNTTAHNITNAGTEGYSRQQVLLTDLSYGNIGNTAIGKNQIGLGTRIADVRLVRDELADQRYRFEFGREEYYQTKYSVVKEIENYFGEMEGSTFRTYMTNLWDAAQELQKESNSIVTRTSYIGYAVAFVDQANEVYKQLTTYQGKLDTEIKDQVDRINKLADTIAEMNSKITVVEAAGIESANDFRDIRDAALDELSGLISISYHEYNNGLVDVYAEHRILVSATDTYKMGTRPVSESCDFLVPIWESDGDDVFRLFRAPSTEDGTDVGSLKGLVMSRGDWVANYTDIPIRPEPPERPARSDYEDDDAYDNALEAYNADLQQYQADYRQFLKDKEYYDTYLEPYTVNNIIAQLDQLIHGIVTSLNDILCPNKEITIIGADGEQTIKVLDEENAGYGMGLGNDIQGTELVKRNNVDRYTEQQVTVVLEDGTTDTITVKVYNEENEDDVASLYTLGNIEVNDALIKNPNLLPLTNLVGEELQPIADRLIHVWQEDFASLGPSSLVSNDFLGYYREFIGDYATKGKTYQGIAEAQNQAVREVDNLRQAVVGVSTDEELSNLIRFQQGYNASSRYFTVVSEMVEHLINRLG